MGPNVKSVSAITDEFSNKKNGGQFFWPKKDQTEGGLAKDHTFSGSFSATFPNFDVIYKPYIQTSIIIASIGFQIHWL